MDVASLLESDRIPIIDVRSRGEFNKGCIPGAISIPLFDDQERASVGIAYKDRGRNDAIAEGLGFVGKRAVALIAELEQFAPGATVYIHCWRGGMRSQGFAWLARNCGLKPRRIIGGYKAYRHAVHEGFAEPKRIAILSGLTGAGKTALLSKMRDAGEQVIDLEALANHRGSAFGGIGQPDQPTVEQFENNLFEEWRRLDSDRLVWIEGESQSIGRVHLPQPFWDQMSEAPTVFVEVDRESRVEFLMDHYGTLPANELGDAIGRVKKRLGGLRHQLALNALEEGDVKRFASIALEYYDKAYLKALEKRPRLRTECFELERAGVAKSLADLIQLGEKITS